MTYDIKRKRIATLARKGPYKKNIFTLEDIGKQNVTKPYINWSNKEVKK